MSSLLIVDDDTNAHAELARYLRDRGHRVATLANPGELPVALEREDFDLVLVAGDMNGSAGSTLLRTVRQRRAGAAVALATAHPTVDEAVAVMRAGAYDYIRKPLAPRRVAVFAASPEPHAMSRYRVPGPTPNSSSRSSFAGRA